MAMTSEFISAINQISSERGIEKEEIFTALESAILVAYKKEKFIDLNLTQDEEESMGSNLTVELDRETGEFKLIATKEVVKKVADDNMQISVADAEMISPNVEAGDSIQLEMPAEEFGRIAAQTAKQVILQKMRESEKDAVLSEYSDKVGEVFSALMQRMQKGEVIFEIGKATAVMPQEEQISNEFYRLGERYKVLLKSIDDSQVIVSRADPKFLIELFKMEVPEIASGVVEIKAVAREAGSRSKIAVVSHQDGVDPIGSCVGQRGIRIANVMNEIGEEKIDIIEWDEESRKFVANALSPAKIDGVSISEETATVTVDEDQLSLAIGREGQNVRLAWKLTGFKIDIVGNGVRKEEEVVVPMADEVAPEVLPTKKTTKKKTAKKDEAEAVVAEEVKPEETETIVEETPVVEEAAKEE
ncbi:MAG: Transcription termination factor NusA [candidate division WS6 bacterium GW2011_GWC1_36_11]|uniref:Transcription termination/antitermination protein NusA n=3 Tax=Candidatus Dojkabacteria TaxID=74243 RepID=A0A0G0DI52_9BACT|nr:MAG: Transcription termination factor NusA [candidate division WS6 bacterium GW2011_GWC1_36_11]KKQ04564.1 MAG: Transcription termination factor NusA [candidate division WS6 bacterium GW2011_WS6_36_26]KKQ10854.1 MAG: Transcription termination factor NusA [candidate division WS6 bacterium GW2011_GWE1_36_69]KKQ12010.1 MAG: Transcription termination factor NusA [candidate division WS6 bacterium GW2011_GWC2_36_7]KKQ15815.1 MAG: Transcription termination factor NusA [candidate division WS6 bacteri